MILIADGGLDCTVSPYTILDGVSFPAPAKREGAEKEEAALGRAVPDAFEPTPFILPVLVDGADAATLSANIDALCDAWHPGSTFQYRGRHDAITTTGHVLTCSTEKVTKHNSGTPSATVTIAGTVAPRFTEAAVYATDENGHAIDGTDHTAQGGRNYSSLDVPEAIRVRGSRGDTFAPVRVKVTLAQGGESIAVGVKQDPPASYQPWQDYAGTTDMTANGDAAASLSMTQNADYATIGTPATLGNDYREPSLVLARVRQSGTASGACRFRARASVTGSGIAVSQTRDHDSAASSQPNDGYEVANLGVVSFPEVPGIATGAGYGAVSELVTQKTGSASVTALQTTYQTVGVTVGQQVTAILLKPQGHLTTGDGGAAAPAHLRVESASGDVLATADFTTPPGAAAEVTIPVTPFVTTSSPLRIKAWCDDPGFANMTLAANTANPYAGGAWSGAAGTDVYFAVLGSAPLGFDGSIAVQAKTTESGKTAYVDLVTHFPATMAEQVFGTFAAGQGAIIDRTAPNSALHRAYITTATAGTVGPVLNSTRYGYGLWMPPGDSDWIIMTDTPKNAPPTKFSVSIEYLPSYTNRE